jgi:peptidoglycan/LPS O-acetylase OafA/YrhL
MTYFWFLPSRIFPFAISDCLSLILLGMIHVKPRWLVHVGDASYSVCLVHRIFFYYSVWFCVEIRPLPDWLCEPWR